MALPSGVLASFGFRSRLAVASYGRLHALSIHFCFQRLHLWVTAYAWKLVYREHIRKYFGTEIWHGAEVDTACRILGRNSGMFKRPSRVCVCLNVRVFFAAHQHPGGSHNTLGLEKIREL